MYIEVIPAYGRDYKNQAAVLADWRADKDFQEVTTRSYINRSGALKQGFSVIIRYAGHRKVMDVTGK